MAGNYPKHSTTLQTSPPQTAQAAIKHSVKKETVDEEMFPEYYRKTDYVKGSNDKVQILLLGIPQQQVTNTAAGYTPATSDKYCCWVYPSNK